MSMDETRQGRRGFVGSLVGGAVAVGAAGAIPRPLAAEAAPPAEIQALVAAWERQQQSQTWDMSWVERITGKHRQVFDAPEIESGTILHQARTIIRGYADIYGTRDDEFSAVLVIRHAAIPMVSNDRLWDELELGRMTKLKDPETGKDSRRNPFLTANNPRGAKHSMIWPDGSLDALIDRGAIVLACNLALFRLVGMIAKKDAIDQKAARDKAVANLVPGVILQPSGVFAVARAEQAGCNYIRAT